MSSFAFLFYVFFYSPTPCLFFLPPLSFFFLTKNHSSIFHLPNAVTMETLLCLLSHIRACVVLFSSQFYSWDEEVKQNHKHSSRKKNKFKLKSKKNWVTIAAIIRIITEIRNYLSVWMLLSFRIVPGFNSSNHCITHVINDRQYSFFSCVVSWGTIMLASFLERSEIMREREERK